MKHFLDVNLLSNAQIMALVERAIEFKNTANYPSYSKYTVATLFYENSTRTRVSFELAALRLGMQVINFDVQNSSESKGEKLEDTFNTLIAMGIQFLIMRHSEDHLPWKLAASCSQNVHIINAGDGMHAHPSQAMLDLMTIIEQKPDLKNLKIAIIGDVRHSRVAASMQRLCAMLQIGELVFVSPEVWRPENLVYGSVTTSLSDGIMDADVVMCLRVQKERLLHNEGLDLSHYHHDYAITQQRLDSMKPDVMIMHPGPINRGIEIDDVVADGKSSYILEQVRNGVFMRMAIIDSLILSRLT